MQCIRVARIRDVDAFDREHTTPLYAACLGMRSNASLHIKTVLLALSTLQQRSHCIDLIGRHEARCTVVVTGSHCYHRCGPRHVIVRHKGSFRRGKCEPHLVASPTVFLTIFVRADSRRPAHHVQAQYSPGCDVSTDDRKGRAHHSRGSVAQELYNSCS